MGHAYNTVCLPPLCHLTLVRIFKHIIKVQVLILFNFRLSLTIYKLSWLVWTKIARIRRCVRAPAIMTLHGTFFQLGYTSSFFKGHRFKFILFGRTGRVLFVFVVLPFARGIEIVLAWHWQIVDAPVESDWLPYLSCWVWHDMRLDLWCILNLVIFERMKTLVMVVYCLLSFKLWQTSQLVSILREIRCAIAAGILVLKVLLVQAARDIRILARLLLDSVLFIEIDSIIVRITWIHLPITFIAKTYSPGQHLHFRFLITVVSEWATLFFFEPVWQLQN